MNTFNNFSLKDKTALVSGASRGIGKAIALAFADAGANVILVSRSRQELDKIAEQISAAGQKAWPFACDISRIGEIHNFYSKVVSQTGPVDILVNVAGTIFRTDSIEFPLDKWQLSLDVNLTAPFMFCQCFARSCIQRKQRGKIINITSLLSERGRPTIPAYAVSKSGLKLLTMVLAVEWAKYKINVNAIGPGYIETELTRPLMDNETFNKWVHEKTPMDRWGTPNDLTGAALFLASGASDFITGQTIYVDGGWLANL
ncbi:SDR family oxidoreductase [candidate division KSB1 bacterium]|nr:SDR family oxidoreductase [candidate division KSB1 bacterium]